MNYSLFHPFFHAYLSLYERGWRAAVLSGGRGLQNALFRLNYQNLINFSLANREEEAVGLAQEYLRCKELKGGMGTSANTACSDPIKVNCGSYER